MLENFKNAESSEMWFEFTWFVRNVLSCVYKKGNYKSACIFSWHNLTSTNQNMLP